jgi:uncharacterized protein (TIGR02996 family)
MTSAGDTLFQAVCERPWDTGPRLAYADWLTANGQAPWAEFIRAQCQNFDASVSGYQFRQMLDDGDYNPLESDWFKQLPRPKGVIWSDGFKGGFAHSVSFASPRAFQEHAAAVFGAGPVDSAGVGGVRDETTLVIVSSPYLERLEWFSLIGISDVGMRLLAACPYLTRLKALMLDGIRLRKDRHPARHRLGDDGALALADSPFLGKLENLYLDNHLIGDHGALALADSSKLNSVTFLAFGKTETERLSHWALDRLKKRFQCLNGWPTS